ncbi:hypothetical protein LguiA_031920 [Lonicera macranthoides]
MAKHPEVLQLPLIVTHPTPLIQNHPLQTLPAILSQFPPPPTHPKTTNPPRFSQTPFRQSQVVAPLPDLDPFKGG